MRGPNYLLSLTAGLICSAVLAAGAFGQGAPADAARAYPARPVRLIAPFPPGSNADSVARVMADPLQKALGQPFIVENRPGATGSIAADFVAKSAPDGYTLFLTTNSPLVVNGHLFKKLSYDPVKDFAPVTRLGVTGFVVMVRPDFQAKTLAELIALARSRPGMLSAGSGGAGAQVSTALLKSMAKLDVIDVPYKGVPQAVTDVLGGTLDLALVDLGNAIVQMSGRKLLPLAVTLEAPTPLAPGVPTVAETLPGYEVMAWFGLVAPAGTPPEIVAKLNTAAMTVIARPEVKAAFANTGNVISPMNPVEFGGFIKSEIAKWAVLVDLAGLKPE
jgi:tripartite-type tricarboxylate transporter receptor subunit TctC